MPRQNLPVWRRYLTVEPVIFFYAYGLMTSFPLFRQYVYSVVSEMKGFPYKELVMEKDGPGCHKDVFELNSTLRQLEEEVQSWANKIDLGNTFFMAIPSLIVAPFWGPWTDKSGRRKPALIAPVIGAFLEAIVMLMVMYLKLPVYVMFVGSAISGCSGFLTTLMLAVMSYIADTSDKTGIAFRIAIIQAFFFMGGVLSKLTSGLWIAKFGFISPTWLILACHLTSGLWVIFLVPENHARDRKVKNRFFDLRNLKVLINIFKKPRPEGARKTLPLLVIAGSILNLTIQGLKGVTTLFVMRSPLGFGPKLVGYFLAYRMFVSGIGGAVGVKLFRTFFSEKKTAAIAIVSQIVEMGILAFANRTWLVFSAPAIGFFKEAVTPVLLGIMSRIVGVNEQGSLFCAYGIMNTFFQFTGAMIFNNVYEATLRMDFKGFVFLLCAAFKLIPLGLISCILVVYQDERQTQALSAEPSVENEETNANEDDEELIKNDYNEDESDETGLENVVSLELIDIVKTTQHHG